MIEHDVGRGDVFGGVSVADGVIDDIVAVGVRKFIRFENQAMVVMDKNISRFFAFVAGGGRFGAAYVFAFIGKKPFN